VAYEIESISKTKDMIKLLTTLKLIGKENKKKARIKKGLRRSTRQKHYRKSVLLVIGNENAAIKAARNIAGVDACIISNITANLLAPGGNPGRPTVWSEHAIKSLEASINKQNLA
jgi:large subunit ribosomal protein L4e